MTIGKSKIAEVFEERLPDAKPDPLSLRKDRDGNDLPWQSLLYDPEGTPIETVIEGFEEAQALGWVSAFSIVEHNGQPFVMYLASIEQLDRFNGKHHLVASKSGKSLDTIPAWALMADGRDLHRWLGMDD